MEGITSSVEAAHLYDETKDKTNTCAFNRIPLEIRQNIYEYAILSIDGYNKKDNPDFIKDAIQFSFMRPRPQPHGTINGVCHTLSSSRRELFSLNKQIRAEALNWILQMPFTWVLVKTNLFDYRNNLLEAGYPDSLVVQPSQVKFPNATINFYFPKTDATNGPECIFAFPVYFIEYLYRAMHVTKGKDGASLTIELHDPPRPPASRPHRTDSILVIESLRYIHGLRKVDIVGELPKYIIKGLFELEPSRRFSKAEWQRWCAKPAPDIVLQEEAESIPLMRGLGAERCAQGLWALALHGYREIILSIRDLRLTDEDDFRAAILPHGRNPNCQFDLLNQYLLLISNAGLCYLKLGNAEACVQFNTCAIEFWDGDCARWSGKSLYRRALANKALGRIKFAAVDFKLALKALPGDQAIKKELQQLKKPLQEELGLPDEAGDPVKACWKQYLQERKDHPKRFKTKHGYHGEWTWSYVPQCTCDRDCSH